eukprot:TRINITY_DN5591_c0_g2_i2.p1 TRINITY_DN5591_c0_g2~~TRINITY_DN5591_c0_g2_i2.p1  ORF type:complete len:191 (-),score=37.40 TRINITY_DN5591_c0_g2_i2:93-665(-)
MTRDKRKESEISTTTTIAFQEDDEVEVVVTAPKRGKPRKTKSVAVRDENNESILNAKVNQDVKRLKVQGVIEEFDCEVEARIAQMRSTAENRVISMHNALQVEILKLPKKTRDMTMKEFLSQSDSCTNATNTTDTKPSESNEQIATISNALNQLLASNLSNSGDKSKIESSLQILKSIQDQVAMLMGSLH